MEKVKAVGVGPEDRSGVGPRDGGASGSGYAKEIAERLGATYTNLNRQLTRGCGELRELRDAA
jgi:hypothetical protein